ncbi:uncharacterized protein LOC126832708 [Patella vulgata]|nr:uncharacterized protein LOC126832708 [Patella vulgata]
MWPLRTRMVLTLYRIKTMVFAIRRVTKTLIAISTLYVICLIPGTVSGWG